MDANAPTVSPCINAETQLRKFKQTKDTETMNTVFTYTVLMAVAVVFSTTAGFAEAAGKEQDTNPVKDSAKPFLEMADLFQNGKGGYSMYHIPGIAVTAKGTVLAWCEARKSNSDWAPMNILLRRSTDNGLTFGEPIMIGHIKGPHTRNPAFNKGRSVTTDNPTYNNPVLIPDGDGAVHGLFCIEYCRAYYTRSDDDGVTWSKPLEITSVFETFREEYDWKVIATGPNHGIQLKNGRLVVPVWLSTSQRSPHHPSVTAVIFSDDGGKTWQAGDIAVPCTDEWRDPNETVAVELSDGRVMLNVRNIGGKKRIVTISPNSATNWSEPYFDDTLPGSVCMAGLVRYPASPDNGPVRLLFSIPSYPAGGHGARRNLKIFMSSDDGRTWPVSRMLWGGGKGAAYSDLAVAADGTILCFFGRGLEDKHTWGGTRLTLARFNMTWLLEGEPKGEYQLPKVAEDQIFEAGEDVESPLNAEDIQAHTPARPNVLFIAVDDLNDWCGVMGGHPQARTPNLDRLAARGTFFDRAYCAAPSCQPSRVAILTGQRPSTSGDYVNEQKLRKLLPDVVTMPQYFTAHGYRVAGGGKVFHHGDTDPRSWPEYFPQPGDPVPKPQVVGPITAHFSWQPLDEPDEAMGDFKVVSWATEWLAKNKQEPFFLAVGFYRPHMPLHVPRKYFDMFPLDKIVLPVVKEDDLDDVPEIAQWLLRERDYHGKITRAGEWKNAVRGYLAAVAFFDAMLGRLIEAFDRSPHRENTVIVLWSDHGWHHGQKQGSSG